MVLFAGGGLLSASVRSRGVRCYPVSGIPPLPVLMIEGPFKPEVLNSRVIHPIYTANSSSRIANQNGPVDPRATNVQHPRSRPRSW